MLVLGMVPDHAPSSSLRYHLESGASRKSQRATRRQQAPELRQGALTHRHGVYRLAILNRSQLILSWC